MQNGDALNAELDMLHWDSLLDYCEPEIAWLNFKNILFSKESMTTFLSLLLRLSINLLGLTPSATPNAKLKTNYI